MTHPTFMIDVAMKAARWERAKGELRALSAIHGAYSAGSRTEKWQVIETLVEQFIAAAEAEGIGE